MTHGARYQYVMFQPTYCSPEVGESYQPNLTKDYISSMQTLINKDSYVPSSMTFYVCFIAIDLPTDPHFNSSDVEFEPAISKKPAGRLGQARGGVESWFHG